jgi:hypothetical protein
VTRDGHLFRLLFIPPRLGGLRIDFSQGLSSWLVVEGQSQRFAVAVSVVPVTGEGFARVPWGRNNSNIAGQGASVEG